MQNILDMFLLSLIQQDDEPNGEILFMVISFVCLLWVYVMLSGEDDESRINFINDLLEIDINKLYLPSYQMTKQEYYKSIFGYTLLQGQQDLRFHLFSGVECQATELQAFFSQDLKFQLYLGMLPLLGQDC